MSSPERIKPVGKAAYTLHLSEHAEAVIGDAKQDTFQPVVTLSKWNGEVSLKLTLDPGKTAPEMLNARLDGDKVKCTVDQGEVHVYPLLPTPEFEEGGLEIMFVLDKKPESGRFTFQVETDNLEFHFQPELTLEEKAHGCVRPDNVVGSFAVYHAKRGNVHSSQSLADKYKTGKAFHIYRPEAVDAAGKKAWANLEVDTVEGVLTVTVPQQFLDNAEYPVVVDPTFGYTSIGASSLVLSPQWHQALISSCPFDASAASITVAMKLLGAATKKAKCAIYKHSDRTLVSQTEDKTINFTTSFVWYTINFVGTYPTLEAIDYLLAVRVENNPTYVAYDTVASVGHWGLPYSSYDDAWQNPGTFSHDNNNISIYCTFNILYGELYERIQDSVNATNWTTADPIVTPLTGEVLYFGNLLNKIGLADIEANVDYYNSLATLAGYLNASKCILAAKSRGLCSAALVDLEKVTMNAYTVFAGKHLHVNWADGGIDYCMLSQNGVVQHYWVAKRLAYLLTEYDGRFAWQEWREACAYAVGKGVYAYNPVTHDYYGGDKLYRDNGLSIDVLLLMAEIDRTANSGALDYARDTLWAHVNTVTHWLTNHYNDSPTEPEYSKDGGLFALVIAKLYAMNGYTLTNWANMLLDVKTRFLAGGWNSPAWTWTTTPYYAMVDWHSGANYARKLFETFAAWTALHTYCQALATADQTALKNLIYWSTSAWQYLLTDSGLYDAATHKFKASSDGAVSDAATAVGIGLFILLGIVPDTGSLYLPLHHKMGYDVFLLNEYFRFDLAARKLRLPVKAGVLKFIYGQTPVYATFPVDGVYDLEFNDEWTEASVPVFVKQLDSWLPYIADPSVVPSDNRMSKQFLGAIRKYAESVTHYKMWLDNMLDPVTGWYLKNYTVRTGRLMFLFPKSAQRDAYSVGTFVRLDMAGFTTEDVAEDDLVLDSHGNLFKVMTVKTVVVNGEVCYRELQLQLLPLGEVS